LFHIHLQISDGTHKPLFKVFKIRVTTLNTTASVIGDLVITQGDMSAVINQSIVSLVTNGRYEGVMYNVTRSPMYGLIYCNDQVVQQFRCVNQLSRCSVLSSIVERVVRVLKTNTAFTCGVLHFRNLEYLRERARRNFVILCTASSAHRR
jgi:hypothetical protein